MPRACVQAPALAMTESSQPLQPEPEANVRPKFVCFGACADLCLFQPFPELRSNYNVTARAGSAFQTGAPSQSHRPRTRKLRIRMQLRQVRQGPLTQGE